MTQPPSTGMTFTAPKRATLQLAKLAGARPEVLAKAPAGYGKQAAMGGVILTTAVLAAVSATFAIHIALGAPIWLAGLLGVGWGVIILNLDRTLVFGMGHEQAWWRNILMAVPRVGLAIILGLVISTPLTLQIFSKEISVQLLVQQQNNLKNYDTQLKGLTDSISQAESRVTRDQTVEAGGGIADPAKDPRVIAATQDVAAKQAAYNTAVKEYDRLAGLAQCEFNGTCGTKKPGDGPQYRSALALAKNQKQVSNAAYHDLTASQSTLAGAQLAARKSAVQDTTKKVANARADQRAASQKLTLLQAQKTAFQKNFGSANAKDTGLLARLEALHALSAKNSTLRTAQLMLAALFLCIEILPVLMKLLMTFGSMTAYDKVALEMDSEDFKTYDHEQRRLDDEHQQEHKLHLKKLKAEAKAAAVARSLIVDNEKDRVAAQRQILREINERVAEEQKKVVLEALEIWARHAARESSRLLSDYDRTVNKSHLQTAPTVGPTEWAPRQDPKSTIFESTQVRNGTSGVRLSKKSGDTGFTKLMDLPPEDEV
jgi:hypothetical protein